MRKFLWRNAGFCRERVRKFSVLFFVVSEFLEKRGYGFGKWIEKFLWGNVGF